MSDPDDDESPRKLELSPTQIAASALAAVSAAFFASWAGTAGTLVGAALGSVIATVGAATYSYSLKRTSEIARRTAAQVRDGALIPPPVRIRRGETSVMPPVDADGAPASGTTAEEGLAADDDATGPWWRRLDPRGKDLPWGRIALASAAVMLVTMVALTTIEGLTGRSVSDTVRGNDSHGTTVGSIFSGGGDSGEQQPSEEPEQEQRTPTQAPSTPEETAPTEEPSGEPSQTPTEEPSQTPTQEPTPGSGDGDDTDPDAGQQPAPSPSATPTA